MPATSPATHVHPHNSPRAEFGALEVCSLLHNLIVSPDAHKSNNRTLAPTDREIIPSQELRFGVTLETRLLCQVFPELPSLQQ